MKKLLLVLVLILSAIMPITANAQKQAAITPFHFVFTADSRDDYTVLPSLSHKMITLNPAFGVFAGDLCGSFDINCINNTWKPALDGNNNDGMLAKTFVSRGNHDNGSLTTWQGLWDFQTMGATVGVTNYTALDSDATYSFDYSNSHFSIIDLPGGGSSSWTSAEISWLDADLTAAEGRGIAHEFIFAHGPMYGVTSQHGSETPTAALKAVLNKHPISAGFHGHEHVTAYTDVTPSREAGINNYQQFTLGRAGAPAYIVVKPVDWSASQNAFADVYVNGSDFTVTIYAQSGSVIFSKTFTDNGGTPVPPTATIVPPTATKIQPTATSVPPTATKVPPTATNIPPTATSIPPTATKVPPTATNVPPTGTSLPPTATIVPPTATNVPPTTMVPPTATAIPPTATNNPPTKTPTGVPPTSTNTSLPGLTATFTNTPTATNISTATSTPSGSLKFPLRLAFYYPWFPEAWTQLGITPYTNYHPSLGWYDSSDQTTIKNQIAAMQYGGIQAGIASWWGQGSKPDGRVSALLQAAAGTTFQWSIYYEQESLGDPSVAQLTSDLTYIRDHYAGNPGFLKIGGRFVVFVYSDGADGCAMADRWKQANTVNAYVVLKVFPGYKTCANQPDGWHQYSPAVAADSQIGYSYAISPSFWKVSESPRLVRDLTRWNTNIRDMIASAAPFQLITTFNEWGEGTAVESASEWSSPSGYGAYLDALHNNGQVAPSPSNTPGSTATMIPSATSTATQSSLPTNTSTPTNVPTNTATQTDVPTNTPTPTNVPTNTPTQTFVPTSTATRVVIATNTPTALPGGTILTFGSEADARVSQSAATSNYGTSSYLQADGNSGSGLQTYLRFTLSGVTGTIQSAKLRVYCTTNGTVNGPAVYLANNTWVESGSGGITWNNQPGSIGSAVDNKGAIATSSWVEYDVTPLVAGNGTYTFVLIPDSNDGVTFSSREGIQPPQLVILVGAGVPATAVPSATTTQTTMPTNTPTQTIVPTDTPTPTNVPTNTPTQTDVPTNTPTPTNVPTNTATQTDAPTNTPTPTNVPTNTPTQTLVPTSTATRVVIATNTPTALPGGTILTFGSEADARVSQSAATSNYGTSSYLQADGNLGSGLQTYLRFTLSGVTGTIQSAKLRVDCTTNGTVNGPAVYLASNSWVESGSGGITWNNQPGSIGSAVDNKGAIATSSWVEYDVTPLVAGNGTYTFVLIPDSNDGVTFSSREGIQPPQLVILVGAGVPATAVPSATATQTTMPTNTPTQTIVPTNTPTEVSTSTPTVTNTPSDPSATPISIEAPAKMLKMA